MEQPPTIENATTKAQSPEASHHGEVISRYVNRVLALQPPPSENVGMAYNDLSPREKADVFYEKLMAYGNTAKAIRREERDNPEKSPEPVDPYLLEEMSALWQDKAMQDVFTQTYGRARMDTKMYSLSELGRNWQSINTQIERKKAEFERETRKLFLQQVTRPDHISATQGRTKKTAKEIIDLRSERANIVTLKDLPLIPENTDIAAQIMFEQLGKYHDQLEGPGFVWLPSREAIHTRTIEALQNGRWPVLKGEAGTGKSEQADAAAVALTGEQPTHLACSSRTNERNLIADKDIDPKTGGSYDAYGPVMQAATGYEDSRQPSPTFKTGRIVRLDESGRLGPEGYSILKELRQKRTATPQDIERWRNGQSIDVGKLLYDKPVLPGFASIWATNPVGTRYPDRTEPDAALRREVADIPVDYPPMSRDNPELYEFMLAALMDQNKHIPIAEKELAPAYTYDEFNEDKQEILPDGRRAIGRDMITEDPTSPTHGALYRLSFAVRSLQDAFTYGNAQSIPPDALRYTIDADTGKVLIVADGGDPLTLSSSTITLREVTSWMKGFHERTLKDDPDFQTKTLTEWIQLKLKTYLNQVDQEDKDKVEALFEHYKLFNPPPDLTNGVPVIPKRIGYLSPRVPRPLHVTEYVELEKDKADEPSTEENKPQPTAYVDKQVMLEDGTTILVSPHSITLNMKEEQ